MTQKFHLENAICLSGEVHAHPQYQAFYDAIGSRIGGFTGIYDAIADMAKQLTAYEIEHADGGEAISCWEKMPHGMDWIETCEAYVEFVMLHAINTGELPNMAWALRQATEEQEAYLCKGCGRGESACSAAPCADVLADREA